jgi:glycosyltransferase involved in cell wall biosynthesis
MKILYFSNDYSPHDHRFLSAIRNGGHEAFHVRLEGNLRQTEDRPAPEGVEIVQWVGGNGKFRWQAVPKYVLSLRRVIKRIQPDLIHAGPIQTCAFIAVLTGFRPILTMSWGFDLMQDADCNRWYRQITRYVLRNSSFFTSDAQVTRDKAVAHGMNPDHTVIFPWGVDLQRYAPKDWSSPGRDRLIPDNSFTIFCNRSWEPLYGIDVLARAFVRAAQSRPGLSLMLLGSGSQGARIRQILMSGGVLDRVTFGGQVTQTELPRWYHWADVYISPSHVDGSSVSLMEALASGLPCLVSDIPGNREWVTEGENGWLFPDDDADALAAKITQAMDQRETLPKIGSAARAVAEERADWTKNSAKLMDAYLRALQLRQMEGGTQ